MARRTFQIVAIVAAVVLVGTVGLTVIATGDGSVDPKVEFLRQLHKLGHHLHGGGHQQDHMARLIEQLKLTPDQLQRLEKVHEILGTHDGEEPGAMGELHDQLVAQFEQGDVETDEVRRAIDRHVEQIRHRAYAVTDELIALANGLDATQREIVLTHLKGVHPGRLGHGH